VKTRNVCTQLLVGGSAGKKVQPEDPPICLVILLAKHSLKLFLVLAYSDFRMVSMSTGSKKAAA